MWLVVKQNDMRFNDAKKKGQLIFISLTILHRRLVSTQIDQHCSRNRAFFKTVQRKIAGKRLRVESLHLRPIAMSPGGLCFGKFNFPEDFLKDLFRKGFSERRFNIP